jgi:hypothetical protein
MSSETQILDHIIKNLIEKFEDEEKSGIFFKLEKDKDPLEILGVLDFLKDKIEKWGNSNIFSYIGSLFENNNTLVIGSSNREEAISIIKYVYLSQVLKSSDEIQKLERKLEDINALELFLSNEISRNIKLGYPSNPKLELHLKIKGLSILGKKASRKEKIAPDWKAFVLDVILSMSSKFYTAKEIMEKTNERLQIALKSMNLDYLFDRQKAKNLDKFRDRLKYYEFLDKILSHYKKDYQS